MRHALLLVTLGLAACAADVGDDAPLDVELSAEALSSQTTVNCYNNGAVVQLKSASPALATACGLAMQNQSAAYACWDVDSQRARCEAAFGSGPTPLASLCDAASSGNIPLRSPPGGYLKRQTRCTVSYPGFWGSNVTYYGERLNSSQQSYFPQAKAVSYGASCSGCAQPWATLTYNVSTSNPTVYYNY